MKIDFELEDTRNTRFKQEETFGRNLVRGRETRSQREIRDDPANLKGFPASILCVL